MNFYFEAAKALDRLDAKRGSVKGVLGTLPEKERKRTAALVIETLKCAPYKFLRLLESHSSPRQTSPFCRMSFELPTC